MRLDGVAGGKRGVEVELVGVNFEVDGCVFTCGGDGGAVYARDTGEEGVDVVFVGVITAKGGGAKKFAARADGAAAGVARARATVMRRRAARKFFEKLEERQFVVSGDAGFPRVRAAT